MNKKVTIFTGLVNIDKNLVGTAVVYKKIADIFIKNGYKVTMIVPEKPDIKEKDILFQVYNEENNKKAINSSSVIIFGAYPPTNPLLYAYDNNKTIMTYLWSIAPIGSLDFKDFRSTREQERLHRFISASYNLSLLMSDKIFCRDEDIKNLVIGSLISLGRINLENYGKNRSFDNLIEVAPFGVENNSRPEKSRERKARFFYRDVLKGVGRDDFLLLWNGGVWNWNDGTTLIKAMDRVKNKKVKLIFQGFKHPGRNDISIEAKKCFDLAVKTGLKDKSIFFNENWIPYKDRSLFLSESNIGVVCSPNILEANLFFKTRIYDYLWSDLPIILNDCEAFSKIIKEKELGLACKTGDPNDWARQIDEISLNNKLLEKIKENIKNYKKNISWKKTLLPVERFSQKPTRLKDHKNPSNDLISKNIEINKKLLELM
jgi:glycosyltransferase involved in cell wall biosynthesis